MAMLVAVRISCLMTIIVNQSVEILAQAVRVFDRRLCDCRVLSLGLRVNCSARGLRAKPSDLPRNATLLILSHNRLQNISAGSFEQFTRLKYLDLSYNQLSVFGKAMFDGLHKLELLNLRGNDFVYSHLSFDKDTFSPLKYLKSLIPKSGTGPNVSNSEYPDKAIGKLMSLVNLTIDGLTNKTFGSGFGNLTALRHLDLSKTSTFTAICKDMFENFKNASIKTLNVSNCNLKFIHEDALFSFQAIETVDFRKNTHLGIAGVMASTKGLQNSTVQRLYIQAVHAPDSLSTLTKEDFQYLKHTELTEIYLDNNSISSFGPGAFQNLPVSLEIISCQWNRIEAVLDQVTEFCVRFQHVKRFICGFQQGVKMPRLQQTFREHTTANSTVKRNIQASGFKVTFKPPPHLWKISYGRTFTLHFREGIPEVIFLNSAVSYLDLSYNMLQNWTGPVKGVEGLRHLDLSSNNCKYVSPYFFGYATGLESLLISGNQFRKHLDDRTFHNLTSLSNLDISYNSIEKTGPKLFARTRNLTVLNFAHNYLSAWEAEMTSVTKLEILNLSYNKLSRLPAKLCRDLDKIREYTQVQVDLCGNPLRCDCDTLDFTGWIQETDVLFLNLKETFCTLPNGTHISLGERSAIFMFLQTYCRTYKTLIGICSVGIGLFLIFLTVSVVHKNRWKLRYLYYMAVKLSQRTGYETLEGNNDDNQFFFDAFMSYEDSSRDQIIRDFIPRLETRAGMKLCIDKRDFAAGQYITDNIMHAILNSRKTVVLLTNAFIRSKYCMYELNMARMEGLYSGREILIIVILEEGVVENFPRELRDIGENQTYLDRPYDQYGEEVFWERLISAIRA